MSSLKPVEKAYFERLLEMADGHVLKFSVARFASLFRDTVGIDIENGSYDFIGMSKAKRLRAFWETESDQTVGRALSELLSYWKFEYPVPSGEQRADLERCQAIVARLLGEGDSDASSSDEFLRRDLADVSLSQVPLPKSLLAVLEARYIEASGCLRNGHSLAAIFLAGSILEGLLLGTAQGDPKSFNLAQARAVDRETGGVRRFNKWPLACLIDAAHELGYIHEDVKKFSHALRDYRNYIHPAEQVRSGFSPDQHTAEICLQVLRAAIASLSKERNLS